MLSRDNMGRKIDYMDTHPDRRHFAPIHTKDEAIDAIYDGQCSQAELAMAIATLSSQGYTNRQLRELTGIPHNYVISHYKKSGKLDPVVLELWHKNPHQISLGHARALSSLPPEIQETVCRDILLKHLSVRDIEALRSGPSQATPEIQEHLTRLGDLMSEHIGRPVQITVKPGGHAGQMILDWFDFDDFDTLCNQLGFNPADHV